VREARDQVNTRLEQLTLLVLKKQNRSTSEIFYSESGWVPSNGKPNTETPSIPSDFQTKHCMSFFKGNFPFGRPSPFTSNQRRERERESQS
jgi:hypothetical protein